MKSKIKNRVLAGFMALLMVVGLVPTSFAGGNVEVKAAGTTYTFESKDLGELAAGTYADGDEVAAGTDNYFTIYMSAKAKVDGSSKSWDDGYSSDLRLNFGGKAAPGTPKNCIAFTTSAAATVTIWWVEGGEDNRQMGIYKSDGTTIAAQTEGTWTKNDPYMSTLTLEESGTYYLGAIENNNNIYKIEVTEAEAAPVVNEYVFESKDLGEVAAGTYADGDVVAAGTDNFFNVYMSAKAKVDGSSKSWDDGYSSDLRLNFGGKAAPGTPKNCIGFKTEGTATVTIWWVEGGEDNRQMGIYKSDGTTIAAQTEGTWTKNDPYMSTLTLEESGTYYLGAIENNNNIYKVVVTDTVGGSTTPVTRKAWSEVADPVLGTPALKENDANTIEIPYTMEIGDDGADSVVITVKDSNGNSLAELKSLVEGSGSKKEYSPTASGTYTFSIVAKRDGETDKTGADVTFDFVLPLETPVIASATSTGAGTVNVVWGAVTEAETYEVYCSGTLVGTTTKTSYAVSGLTVGTKYAFTVVAVRGTDKSSASAAVEATATEAAQTVWAFTRYGSSTNAANNGYEGGVNETGSVTVYSEGGKGKIVPNSTDGLAFYYTTVPSNMNFTLRANVHVDSWTLSNGQEGFGIMAADRIGENGDTNPVWNNSVMAIAGTKVEYYWDSENKAVSTTTGTKYTMKTSVGVLTKSGVTQANLPLLDANDTATVNNDFKTSTIPLDITAAKQSLEAGTYNIVGNATKELEGTIANITDFVLEVQKNNTGYFVTYYDSEGNIINQVKGYDTELLSNIDTDNVYVGFFASRNARATFSDITFTTVSPEEDAPAEEKPIERIVPTLTIQSADVSNTEEYTLQLIANVDGVANIKINGEMFMEGVVLEGEVRKDIDLILPDDNKNYFVVYFTPDPDQEMEEDTVLDNTDEIKVKLTVDRNVYYEDMNTLYVAPWGHKSNRGTRNNPLDIYRAIDIVRPGQTIVLMEGTYLLESTVRIERGIDGTAEQPINMVADPEATTRPILDFQWNCAGMIIGGDYWYFSGFDVTHSVNGQKGIQVSGSNNILDQVDAYHNGNTGIQISRLFSTDTWEDWPANNLILNCTSYGNADAGYEDADGFAAKLTIGDGNVFDGCVAFNNADDGWDLFAKVETGPIGSVTIQNCVAYGNGYLEDGTNAGNGNGFKMGGESISGKHQLINSYAFFNKAKGIDSNSCPDIIVKNSTSYNNESYNVAFYTNNAANTDFKASGIVSFKDESIKSGYDVVEQFKVKGTQVESDYLNTSNYYWYGSQTLNTANAEITADDFVTLIFRGVARNDDGTINMLGFLQLKDTSIGGAQETGTPSMSVTILPNPVRTSTDGGSDDGSSDGGSGVSVATGDTTPLMFLVVVMVASALACVVTFKRRRA